MSTALYTKELPKSALLEKYLLSAKMYEDKNNYKKAIQSFEKIEALHITLPKEFYYRYAINLYHDKQYKKSTYYFKEYILQSDRDDEYYKQALIYLTELEDDEEASIAQAKRCKELPQIIEEKSEECASVCEKLTSSQIDSNLNNYQYTTYEMYDAWYPPCVQKCQEKSVQPRQREYKRSCK